jgi:transcriptional regulator with XRE-family HTH domain
MCYDLYFPANLVSYMPIGYIWDMKNPRLRSLRSGKGLTQAEVARALNMAQPFLSQLESGDKRPNVETLRKIAAFYGVTETYLLGGSETIESTTAFDGPESILADAEAPPGLRELAADGPLRESLLISSDEWRVLRSIELPCSVMKHEYIQFLSTVRSIFQRENRVKIGRHAGSSAGLSGQRSAVSDGANR